MEIQVGVGVAIPVVVVVSMEVEAGGEPEAEVAEGDQLAVQVERLEQRLLLHQKLMELKLVALPEPNIECHDSCTA